MDTRKLIGLPSANIILVLTLFVLVYFNRILGNMQLALTMHIGGLLDIAQ